MAYLHIPLSDFWDYSPLEIDWALKAHFNQLEMNSRLSWEQTRTQIYYSYLLTPSRKRKVSYNTFKADYLPLGFDKEEKEVDKEPITDEQFDSMHNYFKNEEGTQN